MKTAISVDDHLMREADDAARRMGLTRSRLVSIALTEYLHRRRKKEMLEQLNRVYAEKPDASEQRIIRGMKAKVSRTIKDRW